MKLSRSSKTTTVSDSQDASESSFKLSIDDLYVSYKAANEPKDRDHAVRLLN